MLRISNRTPGRPRRATAIGMVACSLLLVALACSPSSSEDAAAADGDLAMAATIHRDQWGVPHVIGPTDESVVFGYMVAQAEDNFWQVEDSLIQALGRSAEVRGAEALPGDLLNRALEIPRLSRDEWERTDPEIQSLLRAAADGLNFYIESHPDEPRLLRHVEPWHLVAFSRFAVYQLFMIGRAGIRPEEMASMAVPVESPAEEAAGELDEAATLGPAPGVPDVAAWRLAFEGRTAAAEGQAEAGSNMWAVTPPRTANGDPLLFINPHQPYFGPGQWYEGHLLSDEGLNFSGAGFFASFMPTIGHNATVGWSHTVNAPDILDVYLVDFDDPANPDAYRYGDGHREATSWTDTVAFRDADGELVERSYRFRRTHHGPIVGERDGRALALRMAMFEEGGQSEMRYRMATARNVEELRRAMSSLATPMFNTVAADAEGNVWYAYYGAVPRRSEDFDWSQPVDGSDPATEWDGYHPLSELPQVMNPASGYVQNCNATPFLASGEGDNPSPDAFPSYMVSEDDNPRSRISRRILEERETFDLDTWAELAFDTRVIEAEVWVPRLVEALDAAPPARREELGEAVAHLEDWDGVSTKDSTAMTLFFKFREAMLVGRVEEPLDALATAVGSLEESWDSWQVPWGEINRLQRIHTSGEGSFSDDETSLPVAGGPGPLGIVFNFYTRPEEGQRRRYGVAGHSFVSVVEFSDPPKARSVLVFGEDADPESEHWFDQARLFADRRFKPAYFTREDVEANAVRSYRPGDLAVGADS